VDYLDMERIAKEAGFTRAAPLDPGTLCPKQEVRDMCQANSCGQYSRRWSCQPGCGSLESCKKKISRFSRGILVQTVRTLEDELDGEGMMEAERLHKASFMKMNGILRREHPDILALGAGCCTLCETCTYPQAPCRFLDRQISSMEAFGLVVLEVCRANDLPYYYGKGTISYTGCFLYNE